MKNSTIFGIIAILVVAGLVIAGLLQLAGINKNEKTIDVTGTAVVTKPSDKAILSVGVETQSTTAKKAEEDNKAISNKMYDALKKLGLTEADYKTTSYNVYPNRDWNKGNNITGYTVSHMIEIDTEKIGLVASILDEVVKAGANNVYGVQFTLKEQTMELARAEASSKATEYARIKAESIASGLGVKITKIVRVSDSTINYMPSAMAGASRDLVLEKGESLQVEPGDVTVTATISVGYGFK